ncbi:MAG: hypothetical protein ABFS35_19920 [Bacteroidota bacterium]
MKINEFGGDWTKQKMDILIKYVPSYLTITVKSFTNQHNAQKKYICRGRYKNRI